MAAMAAVGVMERRRRRKEKAACDRGGSHWVAFHFPLVGLAVFIISGQDKWPVPAKDI
jgi:hypothetical protein